MPHYFIRIDLPDAHHVDAPEYRILDDIVSKLGCVRVLEIDGANRLLPSGQFYTQSDDDLPLRLVLENVANAVRDVYGERPSILVAEVLGAVSQGLDLAD